MHGRRPRSFLPARLPATFRTAPPRPPPRHESGLVAGIAPSGALLSQRLFETSAAEGRRGIFAIPAGEHGGQYRGYWPPCSTHWGAEGSDRPTRPGFQTGSQRLFENAAAEGRRRIFGVPAGVPCRPGARKDPSSRPVRIFKQALRRPSGCDALPRLLPVDGTPMPDGAAPRPRSRSGNSRTRAGSRPPPQGSARRRTCRPAPVFSSRP